MSNLIGANGNFKGVPEIPPNVSPENISVLFPPGFEDILEYSLDSHTNSISITILTDKNKNNTVININQNFYNPIQNGCFFPKFLIEQSFKYKKIDYLNDTRNRFVFNQNELLWICLQHRLTDFKRFKEAYSNLINTDITAIMNFISYTPNRAYNAINRDEHSYIILSIYDQFTKQFKKVNNNQCLGTILKAERYKLTKKQLANILPTLPINFSSESMGEKSKFVLKSFKEEPIYRSVGYKSVINEKGQPIVLSLFPPKQNIPARNKTHVTADAKEIVDFEPTSVFMQDYIPNFAEKMFVPKDACYRKAICVIHPILDNNKFLFGEVYASPSITSQKVYTRETVTEQFDTLDVEVNKYYEADAKGRIFVGVDIENKEIYLENVIAATLVNIEIVGTLGVQKLVFKAVRHAGNARHDSNTGFKGVTTCRNNLGEISIPSLDKKIKPDLVFGMNSFKAKGNGIILARAALAVELGLYTPKSSFGLLNTWDEEEINEASDSLPEYEYTDSFGNVQKVQIGIVYTRYTELCYVYKSYDHSKPFSFEAGRVLHSLSDNRLFHSIWDNYVVEDDKNIVIELEKILLDSDDIYGDDLPILTPQEIKRKSLFTTKDLFLNVRTAIESNSWIIDEELNPKGFILNLTSFDGGFVRIASAKTFKKFCTQTNDKMYMYPPILIQVSRIISSILNNTPQLLYPKTDTNYARNNTPIIQYYRSVKGLLFASEEEAVMLIQKLSRPEVPGFAFKQVTDWILPKNTCVVMCKKTYNRAIKEALGKNYKEYKKEHGFYGLHNRAPFLWSLQMLPVQIWNQDDFRNYLLKEYCIALEDYINLEWNNDIVIFSNDVLEKSQSDVDKQ